MCARTSKDYDREFLTPDLGKFGHAGVLEASKILEGAMESVNREMLVRIWRAPRQSPCLRDSYLHGLAIIKHVNWLKSERIGMAFVTFILVIFKAS